MNSIVGNYGLSSISHYSQATIEEYTTTKNISRQQPSPTIHQKNEEILTTLKMDSNLAVKDQNMMRPIVWQAYTPAESNQCREEIFKKIESFINKMSEEGAVESQYTGAKALHDHLKTEIQYATDFWLASKVLIAESG